MGIRKYKNKLGDIRYKVIVDRRSKKYPGLRARRRESEITSKEAAHKIQLKLMNEVFEQLRRKEESGIPWSILVGNWEMAARSNRLERELSPKSLRDYLDVIHKHTKEWNKLPAEHISRGDVRELAFSLLERGHSQAICHKLRSAINSIFNFGVDARLLRRGTESPAKGLKVGKGRLEEKRPEILTLSEMKQFLSSAQEINHPMLPVWVTALHTGMRNGELMALLWSDIDWENRLIHVTKSFNFFTREVGPTKGRNWREVAISEELFRFLRELRASSKGSKHVLPRVKSWARGEQAKETRELCRIAGISSVKFHAFRACWTTELLRQGVPPAAVMRMGGWASFSRMEIYARLAGIDVQGATDGLKLLSDKEVAKVHWLGG